MVIQSLFIAILSIQLKIKKMKQLIPLFFVGLISQHSLAQNNGSESIPYINQSYSNSGKLYTELINPQNPDYQLSDSLNKYIGNYLLSGQTVKVKVKDNILIASIPGQPEYELVFTRDHMFEVKGAPGFTVSFEKNKSGDIIGFTLNQPDGKIKAKKVSEEILNNTETPVKLSLEQIEKFTGNYMLSGNIIKVYIKENTLMVKISGQQDFELVANSESNFSVKGVAGFSLQFQKDNKGNDTECIIHQPGGTVIAKKTSN